MSKTKTAVFLFNVLDFAPWQPMYMYVENSLAKIPKSLLRNGNGLDEQLYCFTEQKSDNANRGICNEINPILPFRKTQACILPRKT